MKYDVHPSSELVKLFVAKPYQGQDPTKAKVLILGNDANYSPEISSHDFFQKIMEYHSDGIFFWQKQKKHHPFLLDEYPFDKRRGGVRYHLNFSKMGFSSEYAEHFSFAELLNIPTIGNTGEDKERFFELLDRNHLNWLEDVILGGKKKFVMVNQTLVSSIQQIQKKLDVFDRLGRLLAEKETPSVILNNENVVLYNGYSFSHSVTNAYLASLRNEILAFLDGK
jgi:hypothetical protein